MALVARTDGSSWIYRENRVPDYQKKFQQHDGVRLWQKVRTRLEGSCGGPGSNIDVDLACDGGTSG